MEFTTPQILRIKEYEKKMERAEELLASNDKGEELANLIDELEAYYSGPLWMQDYADDEAGLLPKDLKRGVLSQDGLYNLLEEYDNLDK